MGKSKKKPQTSTAPKANIQELTASRNGGQIALRGYTYQFLYSNNSILIHVNRRNALASIFTKKGVTFSITIPYSAATVFKPDSAIRITENSDCLFLFWG